MGVASIAHVCQNSHNIYGRRLPSFIRPNRGKLHDALAPRETACFALARVRSKEYRPAHFDAIGPIGLLVAAAFSANKALACCAYQRSSSIGNVCDQPAARNWGPGLRPAQRLDGCGSDLAGGRAALWHRYDCFERRDFKGATEGTSARRRGDSIGDTK